MASPAPARDPTGDQTPIRAPRRAPATLAAGIAVPAALLAVQLACTAFFLADVAIDLAQGGLMGHDAVEAVAALALVIGTVFGLREVGRALARTRRLEEQVRIASGALAEVIAEHFRRWGLTPAEREVAMLAIKGLPVAEIARLRGTAEGTVKAQSAAIYAKAGVTGRHQLLSLFIEDLLAEPLHPAPSAPAPTPAPTPHR